MKYTSKIFIDLTKAHKISKYSIYMKYKFFLSIGKSKLYHKHRNVNCTDWLVKYCLLIYTLSTICIKN